MRQNIISDPNILGGKPVILGTRIPVDHIILLLKNGYTIEAISKEYPQLNVTKISKVVDEATKLINNASKTLQA